MDALEVELTGDGGQETLLAGTLVALRFNDATDDANEAPIAMHAS